MNILIVLAALSIVSAIVPLDRLGAQGRDSRDEGAAARTDAILGTPKPDNTGTADELFRDISRPGAASAPAATIGGNGQRTIQGQGHICRQKSAHDSSVT
jgi:hypothetical protein